MIQQLTKFLDGKPEGESSVGEVFLAFCRQCGIPPTPANEAECERLLTERGLIHDGTVCIRVAGRPKPPKASKARSNDRINQLIN